MLVSIGIMAWNEAEVIGTTLRSLLEQTIFRDPAQASCRIEIIVVPNGCSDDTAKVAAEALSAGVAGLPPGRVAWRICDLTAPGKANAWNHFVHGFSDPAADFIVLMDADIRFTHPATLANMLAALARDPVACIATDLPQKHVQFKPRKSLFDRISLAIGQMTQAAPGQLTGQLYCARAGVLRRIHMPPGLIVEDGFIKQMVCTDMLTRPVDNRRIVRAADASHVFESYTRIVDVFNNQRRQQVAHTIYVYLREYLKGVIGEKDAGQIIAENNARDPEWFMTIVRERVKQGGWWVMYPGALAVRFQRLRNLPARTALLRLPVALVAFLMDLVILAAANRRLKKGQIKGIWKDTKSYALAGTAVPGAAPRDAR
jgi:glycosyltransferase involved in cell wall biosynthesis